MDRKAEKRAKSIQKAFNNKKLIYSVIQNAKSSFNIRLIFSQLFKSYFGNKHKKPLEERYYFHAFNGCYEKTFKENGLGDISGLDSKIIESFKLLEDELGCTMFSLGGGSNDELKRNFLTTDPFTLMRYALAYSPERLWTGPLGIDVIEGIKEPYKIGETKCQYMMRILEDRIPNNISDANRNKIIEAGKIVCEEFGSKRPRIAIIPESKIKDFDADFYGEHEYCQKKLLELADNENKYWTQNMQSGPNFSSSQGVCVYGNITPDKFVTVSIPDMYELMQIFAIEKGAKIGDLVDPEKGTVIEKSKEDTLLPVEVKKNSLINNLFKLFRIGTSDKVQKCHQQDYMQTSMKETSTIIPDENKPSLTELSQEYQKALAQSKSNHPIKKQEDKLNERGNINNEI